MTTGRDESANRERLSQKEKEKRMKDNRHREEEDSGCVVLV